MGLIEGVHYVKDTRPPEAWRRKCSVIVDDYKHVYSFWNGCVIFMGSLDNPSLLAGKSVIHLFYDEAKYDKEMKVNRVLAELYYDAMTRIPVPEYTDEELKFAADVSKEAGFENHGVYFTGWNR